MRTTRTVLVTMLAAIATACGSVSPVAPTCLCEAATPSPTTPTPSAAVTVVGLTITGNVSLGTGESSQVKVLARLSNGASIDVTRTASLSTSNVTVASVSADGLLKANGPGICDLAAVHQGSR